MLLRQYRLAAGLTQEELAERAELSVRAIGYMESGRTARPYRGSVRSLADALGLRGAQRDKLARVGRRGSASDGVPAGPPPSEAPVTESSCRLSWRGRCRAGWRTSRAGR